MSERIELSPSITSKIGELTGYHRQRSVRWTAIGLLTGTVAVLVLSPRVSLGVNFLVGASMGIAFATILGSMVGEALQKHEAKLK